MKVDHIRPQDIENTSMQIIREELAQMGKEIPAELAPVVMRVIHTTADFEYADTMAFSPGAIEKAREAIRSGARIVTDTNMALAGVNKKALAKWGGEAICFMADPEVAEEDKRIQACADHWSAGWICQCSQCQRTDHGNTDPLDREPWPQGRKWCRGSNLQRDPVRDVRNVRNPVRNAENEGNPVRDVRKTGEMTEQAAFADTTEYVEKDGKRLRRGFTTGSCAAAAATAAAQMLMTGEIVEMVQIKTPGGPVYNAQILDAEILEKAGPSGRTRTSCRCAVLKDGGDDPDITTGTRIVAEVSRSDEPGITIDGGAGIGRVTKPGLDQPVGQAAINRVPRQMIAENVGKILREWQNLRRSTAFPDR